MGCTPSHNGIVQILAKNTAKPLKRNKALLPPSQDTNGITVPSASNENKSCRNVGGEPKQTSRLQESENETYHREKAYSDVSGGVSRSGSFSEDQRRKETHRTTDEGTVSMARQKKRTARKYSSTGSERDLQPEGQQDGNPRRGRKSKSRKSGKRSRGAKHNDTVFQETEKKVDFPEILVKAHQDAYAFLNPNLSKYDGIISMANQAAQTQLIMQQMTSFMALRFDEINKCLGEIGKDGEHFLRDAGSNLTWPCGKDDPSEHPDLLQQLLQYTVNRMQSVNCTVSTLTTNALQDICSFLQSAVNCFQEKLKEKEHHDENLLKIIKALENSATGSTESQPNDITLYSEDSGLGGDNESMRGWRTPDKMERRASVDTCRQQSLARSEGITAQQQSILKSSVADSSGDLKTGSDRKEKDNDLSRTKSENPRVSKQISFTSSLSTSSLGTTATLEQDSNHDQDPEESTSSDDSYEASEDNSFGSQITLPQRPLTSPAGTYGYKHSPKWIENPENEEMSLKMKEAISEKIKFVPGKSNSDVWTREEVNSEGLRPSTADGSNRRTSRHRRSRSAESLKSQAEDPTLLELQRTQKELNKKLEQFYSSDGSRKKEQSQNCNIKSFVHTGCLGSSATPTNKLKACLDKSFNILPSQEKISLKKQDNDAAKDSIYQDYKTTVAFAKHAEDTKDESAFVQPRLEGIISPRQSVRKLIQAFSPEDVTVKSSSGKMLGPLRCVRKFGVPVLPPTIPAYRGLPPLSNKVANLSEADANQTTTSTNIASLLSFSSQDPNKTETSESGVEDLENLPPPPLEILMDDSFNLLLRDDYEKENTLPGPIRNTPSTSKIKASIIIKDLLPNKNSTETYRPTVKTSSKKESVVGIRKFSLQPGQQNRENEQGLDCLRKHEIDEVAHLYKQSHKIIPLQNPSDGEIVKSVPRADSGEQCPSSLMKAKQGPHTVQRNEKSPTTQRRPSPTRAMTSSPPIERKLASPPMNRAVMKSRFQVQPSPPPVKKNTSPTSSRVPSPPSHTKNSSTPPQRKLPSPPQLRREQSPPSQRNLPSPPQTRKQQSPPSQRKVPSPPSSRREPSPPSHYTPSPPHSPSFSHRGLRRSSDDPPSSPKMIGNAQSIFCPSSTSLFEAKPSSPPCTNSLDVVSKPASVSVLRHNLSSLKCSDQQRRVAMSAANPQPFVRRCYSDRRPRVQLRIPTFPTSASTSSLSESALQQQSGASESTQKDSQSASSPGLADPKASSQRVSPSELCVVGQGLQ
ncbi:photoreceptor cilium actin regulator [Hyperolius riggenbachi]|uniref:photoreceptor cilium actin regulator n=1 Tax=Hyperolius riggenbachi TaxID=752182 RepID=UPI0035A29D76